MNNYKDKSKVYSSAKCGDFRVVQYVSHKLIFIEFIGTGYKAIVTSRSISERTIKDKMLPSVYGVGFPGDGEYKPRFKGVKSKIYVAWTSMLQRCYDQGFKNRYPTYIGCEVCPEWHNFQVFAQWMSMQDWKGMHLDKDIIVKGNKTYGPKYCKFVTEEENLIEAHAKSYSFISDKGERVDVYNLAKFCRDNNLNCGNMCQVQMGNRISSKGWSKAI
ncbi:MAG: hypothetical protein COA84_15030 [Robiginitomaculum sp.]|nr:MAG: hypothetical protein COA84_15030 [Robiginitomaculum sp.]